LLLVVFLTALPGLLLSTLAWLLILLARLVLAALVPLLVLTKLVLICWPLLGMIPVKFGAGCIGPVSTYAVRFGACAIADTRSRIWCPNGQIFDRNGSAYEVVPSSYVVRAICSLDQVL
jgi:hypothetical protein